MGAEDRGGAQQEHRQRREDDRLRDVDGGDARLALRQMDRGDNRAAHAEHQAQPRAEREERGGDIDRGQRVAPDAPADEDAVGEDKDRRKEHPQYGGDEETAEEPADGGASQVDGVALHNLCFHKRCKNRDSAVEKSYHGVISAGGRRPVACNMLPRAAGGSGVEAGLRSIVRRTRGVAGLTVVVDAA